MSTKKLSNNLGSEFSEMEEQILVTDNPKESAYPMLEIIKDVENEDESSYC